MSECLEWPRTAGTQEYGRTTRKGVQWLVHRLAWFTAYGPIPKGQQVLHRCDNPPCHNVEHLFLGTQADNMQDMLTKGRNPRAAKTHCPRNHEYNEINTYRDSRNRRFCRQCDRDRRNK